VEGEIEIRKDIRDMIINRNLISTLLWNLSFSFHLSFYLVNR